MAVVIDTPTPLSIKRSGLVKPALTALTGTSAGSGIKFPNDGKTFVEVLSTGGTTVATLTTQQVVDGLAVASPTVSIAIGVDKFIGPFGLGIFNVGSGADQGDMTITFDIPTQVTYTVYRLS